MDAELQRVDFGRASLDCYAEVAGADAVAEARELAEPLAGLRVLHLSATGGAGGVSEALASLLPLLRDVGVDARWSVLFGDPDALAVERALRDAVQGGEWAIAPSAWGAYLQGIEECLESVDLDGFDAVVCHDPQTAAFIAAAGKGEARWVWRCHVDASEPDPAVWSLIGPRVAEFGARVFSMPIFVPPDLPAGGLHIVPPAIDPLGPKNVEIPWSVAGRVLRSTGIALTRPLVCQAIRFDPWKDPLGAIEAWHLARTELPGLQFALVGAIEGDDPEGWRVHREISEFSEGDDDLHVLTSHTGTGAIEVNAIQRLARCAVQRSIREGFGLAVSETLWKGTPVIAGEDGGAPAQLRDGEHGHLVRTEDECAERIVELVTEAGRAVAMGRAGREHVRTRFLATRLLAAELQLLAATESKLVAA